MTSGPTLGKELGTWLHLWKASALGKVYTKYKADTLNGFGNLKTGIGLYKEEWRINFFSVIGRMHGAQYRSYGYVPLMFGGNVIRRMGTQQQ